eukprot:28912-Rhodomonas_salina.2
MSQHFGSIGAPTQAAPAQRGMDVPLTKETVEDRPWNSTVIESRTKKSKTGIYGVGLKINVNQKYDVLAVTGIKDRNNECEPVCCLSLSAFTNLPHRSVDLCILASSSQASIPQSMSEISFVSPTTVRCTRYAVISICAAVSREIEQSTESSCTTITGRDEDH